MLQPHNTVSGRGSCSCSWHNVVIVMLHAQTHLYTHVPSRLLNQLSHCSTLHLTCFLALLVKALLTSCCTDYTTCYFWMQTKHQSFGELISLPEFQASWEVLELFLCKISRTWKVLEISVKGTGKSWNLLQNSFFRNLYIRNTMCKKFSWFVLTVIKHFSSLHMTVINIALWMLLSHSYM